MAWSDLTQQQQEERGGGLGGLGGGIGPGLGGPIIDLTEAPTYEQTDMVEAAREYGRYPELAGWVPRLLEVRFSTG